MKLKSIEIDGMHNASDKRYELSDVNYFYGKNGVGKSTILQAIQLAVLGYVPGNKKQNAAIMKHGKGKLMNVSATFDANGSTVKVERSYMKKGNSVQSSLYTDPEEYPVDTILGEIELPVCNFNEFLSMSSNAQKAWFLKMIPSSESKFSWTGEFKKSAETILGATELEEFIKEFNLNKYATTVDGCNQLNAVIKQKTSLLNALLKDVTGAINSSIMHDDIVCSNYDEELEKHRLAAQADSTRLAEIKSLITSYDTRRQILESYEAAKIRMNEAEKLYEEYKEETEFVTDKDAERYKHLESEKQELQEDISSNTLELGRLKGIIDNPGVCPYLKTSCDDLKSYVETNKKQYSTIQNSINKANIRLAEIKSEQAEIAKLMDEQMEHARKKEKAESVYQSAVDSVTSAESLLQTIDDDDSDIEQLKADLEVVEQSFNQHSTMIAKLAANKKYEEFISSIESKKYLYEQQIQCCKIWDKLTGPNGKPSELAIKPFEDFEKELTEYIHKVFPSTFSARFNISDKANSFEFGVMNSDKFISFEALSSGEKCAYMICLLSCIVDKSNAKWRCIILDDVFDHLDDERMEQVFSVINEFSSSIQFILASVKDPCNSAVKNSIEVKL